MIPILYPETETTFVSNGIGFLSDTISAKVLEKLNGIYELEIKYPLDGIFADQIIDRALILAKPDPVTDPQPFRVYRINPVSKGTAMVYARHLAYDLMGIPAAPFTASSAADAMNAIVNAAAVACPFTLYTDKNTAANMVSTVPKSIWKLLGGTEGSLLDTYGGEYQFDRYMVKLLARRGTDRGVSIRYGKNLTTLEQDRNCANCYTGVYPYWVSTEGQLVQLTEKVIHAEGSYTYVKILELDLSDKFETAPTEEQLRARAVKYMEDNQIGVPDISWKVQFVQLDQTEEYKDTAILERVLMGDTVNVVFPKMGVNASARVVETDFDPILERYNSVTLGRVKTSLADTIVKQQQEIAKKPNAYEITGIVSGKLADAMGAAGGHVRILDTNGDGSPDEIYIADNADPAQAVKVWRWNYQGWAASKTGYNGPFTLGATLESGLLAEFVTAAKLIAGTIQSADGEAFFLDLDNGILQINSSATTVDGENLVTQTDIATLQKSTNSISASVSSVSKRLDESISGINGDITNLSSRVDAAMTADAVKIEIKKEMQNVDRVETKTGFVFDENGLLVEKSGSEMATRISEDGMAVTQNGEKMLTANHQGVDAKNLHAVTYLIIGQNSRMEDYGDGTGCFYIGEGT